MCAQHNIHSIRMLERENRAHFILLATHNSEFDSKRLYVPYNFWTECNEQIVTFAIFRMTNTSVASMFWVKFMHTLLCNNKLTD